MSFVSDQFSLTTGSSPVSQITLGIPSSLSSKLRFTEAVDSQSDQLRISPLKLASLRSGGNYSAMDIAFPSAKTGTYRFNLTSVYSDLLNFNSTSSNFTFAFEPFPLMDDNYTVTSATLSVKTGDWPSPKVSLVNGTFASATFTSKATPLQAFNTTVARMTFSSSGTSQTIFDVTANRTITLSQTGSIQVTDFYNMTNKGHDLSSLILPLPKNVQTVTASDIIGRVGTLTAATATDGTNTVTFIPRFGTVKARASSSVRISYALPSQSYLTPKGLGRFELSFRLFDNVKFFESSLQMKIVTPMGFRLDSFSGQTFTSSGNQILVQVSTVTPMSNLSFTMDYQLDPFWASLSALGWAGLAVGSIAAVVLAVGATGASGATVSGAPSELIGRFVELYDEKSAMRLEAEKMDEDLARGALNRHEFKRRRRVIGQDTGPSQRPAIKGEPPLPGYDKEARASRG